MKKTKYAEAIQGIEHFSQQILEPTQHSGQEINCTKFRKQKMKKGIIFETMAHICGNIDTQTIVRAHLTEKVPF